MDNSLRYISISHKSAALKARECYHFSDAEQKAWVEKIRLNFEDVQGLLILVTCNRTEIYFESKNTTARQILHFIINGTMANSQDRSTSYFSTSDETLESVKHILEVSSGLASSVLGDSEIIHQIKMAYHQSCQDQLQGSLLERCMQSVFKCHKRISNETRFRDGTTSVAYKALKLIASTFNTVERKSLKILFIGAGDIVKQLLNYNNKFEFNSVYVANRTAQKAEDLTQKFGGYTYDWDRVLANDFKDFNVIVTAVSNRPNLVNNLAKGTGKSLILDLAVPGNTDKQLADEPHIIHYDLDSIAKALKENHDNRMKSIDQVEKIIKVELQEYVFWLKKAPARKFLSDYKTEVVEWVNTYLHQHGQRIENDKAQLAINRIIRRSFKQQGKKIPEPEMELILEEHI
ncbi:MAG: glutamyl-tRNA reductase [Flavobacteriaceae bacterium]